MKKRRTRNISFVEKGEVVFGADEFFAIDPDIQINTKSQKNKLESKVKKPNLSQVKDSKASPQQKSCFESFRLKIWLYCLHLVNFLQYDRILTQQEFDELKQDHIIKTKYPQNYDETYEQRSKSFGISMEQIIKIKNQEEQIKNKNFWTEFKRFVCCDGGSQLEEADELLTAASQSQFLYLAKVKKQKLANQTFQTEQSFLQKLNKQMVRQERELLKDNTNIFEQNKSDSIVFDQQLSEIPKKNTLSKIELKKNQLKQKNKQKVLKDKLNIQKNKEEMILQAQKEKQIQNLDGFGGFGVPPKKKVSAQNSSKQPKVKNTQKVIVQNKIQRNLALEQIPTRKNQFSLDNENIEEISLHEDFDLISKIDKNQKNQDDTTLTDINLMSINNSNKKFTPADQNTNIQSKKTINLDNKIKRTQVVKDDFNSNEMYDEISFTQSEQANDFSEIAKLKKTKKQKRNKDFNQILGEGSSNVDFSNVGFAGFGDQKGPQINKNERQKDNASSSSQLPKKHTKHSNKNSFNLNSFDDGIDFAIKQDKQQQDGVPQSAFSKNNTLNESTVSQDVGSQSPQKGKRKKMRTKKLFNLKQEQQNMEEIIIIPQDDLSFNRNTVDVNQTQNPAKMNSQTVSVSKHKRNKKIRNHELGNQDDQIMIIQASQMLEENDQSASNNNNAFYESNQAKTSQDHPSGLVKVQKKRKKKAKLREEMEKQQQDLQVFDLGDINY